MEDSACENRLAPAAGQKTSRPGSMDDGFGRNGRTRSPGMDDRSARRTCLKNRFACVGVDDKLRLLSY